MLETKTVTNGPRSNDPSYVCHDTLPWLISFSLGGLVATICPEQRSVFILTFPGGWTVTRCLIPVAAPGLAPRRMSTRKRPEAFHVQSLVGDRQRKRTGPQHRRSGARIARSTRRHRPGSSPPRRPGKEVRRSDTHRSPRRDR